MCSANSSHLCLLVCKQMLRPANSVSLNNVLVYLPITLVMEKQLYIQLSLHSSPRTHIKRTGPMARACDPSTGEVETGEAHWSITQLESVRPGQRRLDSIITWWRDWGRFSSTRVCKHEHTHYYKNIANTVRAQRWQKKGCASGSGTSAGRTTHRTKRILAYAKELLAGAVPSELLFTKQKPNETKRCAILFRWPSASLPRGIF